MRKTDPNQLRPYKTRLVAILGMVLCFAAKWLAWLALVIYFMYG